MRKCCFSERFIRDEVDPRVQEEWLAAFGVKAPFGKLRQVWKVAHCPLLDPYDLGCPYPHQDCAMAFLTAVQRTCFAKPSSPSGYFRSVAKSLGLDRVDNRPLARDNPLLRTDVHKEGHPGGLRDRHLARSGGPSSGLGSDAIPDGALSGDEAGVRRADHRPVSVGDVLGSLNLGPHQRPAKDGKESNK